MSRPALPVGVRALAGPWRSARHAVALAALPYLASRLAMGVAAWIANGAWGFGRPQDPGHLAFLQAWFSWDAVHYIDIAKNGYRPPASSPTFSFFPGLPAVLHYPLLAFGGSGGAALAVALLGGLVGLAVLAGLTADAFGEGAAVRTAWVAAWWPVGFVWSAVYTEGIFLALAAGCFWAAWKGRPWLAAGLALVAGLFRPTAVGLALPLLVMLRGRQRLLALAPVVGVAVVMVYFFAISGDFFAYSHSQHVNHGLPIGRPWEALMPGPQRGEWVFGLAMLAFVAILCLGLRHLDRLRRVSAVTVAGLLLPALAGGAIPSFGRYAMVAFPLYWVLQLLPGRVLALLLGPSALLVTVLAGSGRLTP